MAFQRVRRLNIGIGISAAWEWFHRYRDHGAAPLLSAHARRTVEGTSSKGGRLQPAEIHLAPMNHS
jgi:hypothetical protein